MTSATWTGTAEAQANLAAVNYHFGSKEALRAECDAWLARCGPLADLHPDELVKRGIILPRDEKYEVRLKTGQHESNNPAKKKNSGKATSK